VPKHGNPLPLSRSATQLAENHGKSRHACFPRVEDLLGRVLRLSSFVAYGGQEGVYLRS
jgi:hypothetical protein